VGVCSGVVASDLIHELRGPGWIVFQGRRCCHKSGRSGLIALTSRYMKAACWKANAKSGFDSCDTRTQLDQGCEFLGLHKRALCLHERHAASCQSGRLLNF